MITRYLDFHLRFKDNLKMGGFGKLMNFQFFKFSNLLIPVGPLKPA
jgi:hypothetical protein